MKEKNIENGWKSDVKDWSKLDLDAAKFYIAQAEQYLKETTETYNLTSNRTDRYLVLLTSLFAAIIGYLITGKNSYLQTVCFFAIFPATISFYYAWKNFNRYVVYTIGEMPKLIFTSEYIDEFEGSNQYKILVYNTMLSIQYRIEQNTIINNIRTKNNAISRKAMVATVFAFLAAAIYQCFCGYQLVWSLVD